MQNTHTQNNYRLYGRRQSRPLGQKLQQSWEQFYDKVTLSLDAFLAEESLLDTYRKSLFSQSLQAKNYSRLRIEIGCGTGEHILHQAQSHPDIAFIGIEPFVNGYAKIVQGIVDEGIENLRLYHGDARHVMEKAASQLWDHIDIHYPDPWPKKKHAKRRLVQTGVLAHCARTLKAGGKMNISTDDPQYQQWIWDLMQGQPNFSLVSHPDLAQNTEPHENWVPTRYEEKAIKAGRRPLYMRWQRRSA